MRNANEGFYATVNSKGQVVADPNDPAVRQALAASAAANPNAGLGNSPDPGFGDPNIPGNGPGSAGGAGTDWSSMLGIYGLPPDVAARVQQIFASTNDVNQAVQLALAYVRGTQWYAKTYPGIQEGIARGVIGNEADYRAYVNQLNQLNQQYYGSDITSEQITNYLRQGYSVGHVGQLFSGDAYVKANAGNIQYALGAFGGGQASPDELQALGQENAGLDSTLGQRLQNALTQANQKMQRVFSGSLATPNLSLGGGGGLQAPSLAGNRGTTDVAA